MKATTSLANHFLIAMPALKDPNFARTVTLVCEHSDQGAMGIVVNRLTDLKLGEVFGQIEIDAAGSPHAEAPLYHGGPVQQSRGFVIHEPLGHWDATLAVSDTIGVSTSRDILEAIAAERGPDRYLVALGYAGWGPGQLEHEITENAWLHCPADRAILFDSPLERRWHAAAALVGVDLSTLTGEAGHA